jgi:hypothetical protein
MYFTAMVSREYLLEKIKKIGYWILLLLAPFCQIILPITLRLLKCVVLSIHLCTKKITINMFKNFLYEVEIQKMGTLLIKLAALRISKEKNWALWLHLGLVSLQRSLNCLSTCRYYEIRKVRIRVTRCDSEKGAKNVAQQCYGQN